MDEAAVHFTEAIEHFISSGEQPDSREISSTYYMMGLSASLDQKYEDAIKHFSQCSRLMASQISNSQVCSRLVQVVVRILRQIINIIPIT